MSRILIIYTNMDPATELSVLLIERFSMYINAQLTVKSINELKRKDVDCCDIIVSIRTQSCREASVIRYAKKHGKMYCLMIDDDFLAIRDYKTRRYLQYRALTNCIECADVLLCTNDSLGIKLQSLSSNGKYVRVDTAVDTDEIKPYTKTEDGMVNIVYYVNDGSMSTYEELVQPLIEKCRSIEDTIIKWNFIGISPSVSPEYKEFIKLYNHMELQKFKDTLANSGFSLGIAPLMDNEFNSGKYVNKFFEFTCAGLPCIYSNVEPYSSFIHNNTDGLLVNNNVNDWIESIRRMSDNHFRKSIVDNAQTRIHNEMSYEAVFERILEQCPSFKDYACNRMKATPINKCEWVLCCVKGRIVMVSDPLFRIIGRLKCEGLKSLVTYSVQKLTRSKR